MYRPVRRLDIKDRLSPLALEVYDVIRDQHPGDDSLDSFFVNFTFIPGDFATNVPSDDRVEMVMSTSLFGLTPKKYRRFSRVVGPQVHHLPKKLYQTVLQAYIWGHECGHLVQDGSAYRGLYGVMTPYDWKSTEAYALSDEEMNADFISVRALAQTSVSSEFEIRAPHQEPLNWREWQAEQQRKYALMKSNRSLI